MAKMIIFPAGGVSSLAGMVLVAALSGCVAEVSVPGPDRPPARVQTVVVAEDDYIYYPEYETYYSSRRHEYVYREGSVWVRRPEPRGVTLNVLLAAPSVRLDFHDSPEQHHSAVVQSYPRNWAPPGTVRVRNDVRVDAKPEVHREVIAVKPEVHGEIKAEDHHEEKVEDHRVERKDERQVEKKDDRRDDKQDDHRSDKKDDKKDDKGDRKDDDKRN